MNYTSKQIMDLLFEQQLKSWHFSGFMIGMFAFYLVLFCVGLVGNFWVITVLISILKNLRLTSHQNVFIYILCLSSVDSLVVMLLPILVSDAIMFHWIFGAAFCKLYLISESINKMLSTFILAALSFDRYLAICCSKERYKIRTPAGTVVCVLVLMALVVVFLMPVHLYARETVVDEVVTFENRTYVIGIPKCMLEMSNELLISFTTYIFSVGFCLPSLLIIFFYARVLFYLYKHTKHAFVQSQIPLKRITGATLMIVLFYFVCWAPYWAVTMFGALAPENIDLHPIVIRVFYVINSLVYVNSAFNWVLYAFLNNNLRDSREQAIEKKRSRKASCATMRMESVINSRSNSLQNIKLLTVE